MCAVIHMFNPFFFDNFGEISLRNASFGKYLRRNVDLNLTNKSPLKMFLFMLNANVFLRKIS